MILRFFFFFKIQGFQLNICTVIDTPQTFAPLTCKFFVLCPNLCEPSLTQKNLGQWCCSSGQFVAHVLFFGAMDLRARDPPPKTTLCGISRCVVWCVVVVVCCVVVLCVGAVCRCKIFVCVQDFCVRSPRPRLHWTSSRWTAQNFTLFPFLLPHFASFLPLLEVVSWNFGGVVEAPGPSNVCGAAGGFTLPENSKRAHLRVPAFNDTTEISRNDPQERKKQWK